MLGLNIQHAQVPLLLSEKDWLWGASQVLPLQYGAVRDTVLHLSISEAPAKGERSPEDNAPSRTQSIYATHSFSGHHECRWFRGH